MFVLDAFNPLDVVIVAVAVSLLAAVRHIALAKSPADRAIASDLLTFAVVALLALVGMRFGRLGTMDLVVVATLVSFLSAVSLARGLTGGER